MIFWILFSIFVTFVWGFGSVCGFAAGYRRGAQETVKLNDAAYRSKLAAETEAQRVQNENYTAEVKKRVTHQLEEIKRLNLGTMIVSPQEPPTQVTTESGKVIEFPGGATDATGKPVA